MSLEGTLDVVAEPKLVVKHTFLDWSYDEEVDEEGDFSGGRGRGRGRSMSDFDVSYGGGSDDNEAAPPEGTWVAARKVETTPGLTHRRESCPVVRAEPTWGNDGEASDSCGGRDAHSGGEGESATVSTATPEEDREEEDYAAVGAFRFSPAAPAWCPSRNPQSQQSRQQPQQQLQQLDPRAPLTGLGEDRKSHTRKRRSRRKATDALALPEAPAAAPATPVLPHAGDVDITPVERTTLMLRNLPNMYTRNMLCELLDSEGLASRYDFVYAPIDFIRQAGLGFAFVNMLTQDDAEHARTRLHGYNYWNCPSTKILEVSWSDPFQGLRAHIERYQNSPVMHDDVPDEYKPALFTEGVRVSFPTPVRKIRPPRVKRSGRACGHGWPARVQVKCSPGL